MQQLQTKTRNNQQNSSVCEDETAHGGKTHYKLWKLAHK
jgi:hypothetical protein